MQLAMQGVLPHFHLQKPSDRTPAGQTAGPQPAGIQFRPISVQNVSGPLLIVAVVPTIGLILLIVENLIAKLLGKFRRNK